MARRSRAQEIFFSTFLFFGKKFKSISFLNSKEFLKSSQLARIYSPGHSTGNKLFFKDGPMCLTERTLTDHQWQCVYVHI